MVRGQLQKGSLSFVSSTALASILPMSRRSSLEVVGTARRPSSVSTFSDIFVRRSIRMVRQGRGFDPFLWISSVADSGER